MGEQYHLFPSSFNALKSHIDFKLFTGLYWPALLFNQSKSHPSFLWGGGEGWVRGGAEIMLKQKVTRTKTIAPLD